MVGNKWGFYDKGVKFRLTLCIFPKNNAFSIIMFRWPLSWCCHSSPFSFNEYNKQEWTSAICSCYHCLWTARCFREVYFSFKPLSNNVQGSEKKKKLVRFCQLSPFPDVFGMRNAVGQLKRSFIFRSIWEARLQCSPRALRVLRNSSALGGKVSPWLYDHANPRMGGYWGNGAQVFQPYSDKEKILAWRSPCLGKIS